jgi:hypothetical protein
MCNVATSQVYCSFVLLVSLKFAVPIGLLHQEACYIFIGQLKKYKTNRNAASRTTVVFFLGHSLKHVGPIGLKDLVLLVSFFVIAAAPCWNVLPFYSSAWKCALLMRRCTILVCSPFLLVSIKICWSNRIFCFILECPCFLLVNLEICWSNRICCFMLELSPFLLVSLKMSAAGLIGFVLFC